jgi:hypothetical protein
MCHYEHKKFVYDAYNKLWENIHSNLHKCIRIFKILKIYNLEIYMHFRLCMHEYFDLILT